MTRIWPMDNFAYLSIQGAEQVEKEDICTTLYDLCRIAPRMVGQFGFSLNRNTPRREEEIISQFMLENVKRCTTVREIAELCLKLCEPYKFPVPDNANETTVKHIFYEFEKVFHEHIFNEAVFRYLIIQYLYIHKPIKMDEINNESIHKIVGQFDTEKSDALNPKTLESFSFPCEDFYISNILNIDYKNGDSVYDFIIKSGLDTVKTKWNPYVINYMHSRNIIPEKEISRIFPKFFDDNKETFLPTFIERINSLKDKQITPKIFAHFLSYFRLPKLVPIVNNTNFNSVSNYIIERITNVNLINCLQIIYGNSQFLSQKIIKDAYETIAEYPRDIKENAERHLTYHFYLLANYPLVSYRLDLLRLLCQVPIDYSCTTTENKIRIIDHSNKPHVSDALFLSLARRNHLNPSIRLDYLHNIILFQSLFYFPLLTQLFRALLFLRGKIIDNFGLLGLIKENDNFVLEEDICTLFQGSEPREPYPTSNSKQISNIYQNIQFCINQLYYEQVIKLKDYNFIDVGYSFGKDIFHYSDSLIEELGLDLTKQFRYSPAINEEPIYINYRNEKPSSNETAETKDGHSK